MLTIKCDVKLFSWQIDVVKSLNKHPHAVHVVKSKRLVGKSTVAELIILKYALEKKNSKNFYMSPTYKLARKVYESIADVIRDTSPVKKLNNTTMEIYFVNGSKIAFLSAEQSIESLQGYTCSGIMIVDEAAFIPDEVYHAISPYVDVYRAPTLIISTPVFRSGFFYELYTLGIDDDIDNVQAIDFSQYDTSALLSAEKLEFYRKSLPKIKFTLQYLGEFADLDGDVFGNISDLIVDRKEITSDMNLVFGVDFSTGVGNDDTVIAIWDKKSKTLVDINGFNNKDSVETVNYIIDLVRLYKPSIVQVEVNSLGTVFRDLLKKELIKHNLDTKLKSFTTSNQSKERIVNQMLVAIQNKEVRFVKNEKLINQMSSFQAKKSANNKIIYGNDKDQNHDDYPMAMMIGWDAVCEKSYAII